MFSQELKEYGAEKQNLESYFRIPGSINTKNGAEIKVFSYDDSVRYTLNELQELWLDELPKWYKKRKGRVQAPKKVVKLHNVYSLNCNRLMDFEKIQSHLNSIGVTELRSRLCFLYRNYILIKLKYQNGEFKTVTQEDILGKWSVFFFYPADFTFVCPTELVDMAEKYEQFKAMGVEVYSVSTDSHFVHKAWHDASESIRKIQYPMLADPTGALSRAFGVMIEEDGMAYRGTFVVNPEGLIKLVEIQDNSIGRNADELLRKVEAAQFVAAHDGEVCPAKWKKGAETLKPSIDLVGKI